jgi:ABC-2 type transport system ATP-binding protein
MTPIVQVSELIKTFGMTAAIDGVSFEVPEGEILGVLGPNGAGKTTLLSMLMGLITPTAGEIRIFGMDYRHNRVQILRKCNTSSAFVALPGNLSVDENLMFFARLYGVTKPKVRIAELLEMFEVAHLRRSITGRLSSGESARVNLCKALLNDPGLIFFDEPTASLDPDMADKFRKHLRALQKHRPITMLYTSHNMRDVEEVCDRILFLQHGKILTSGSSQEILEKFGKETLEEVFIQVAREDQRP